MPALYAEFMAGLGRMHGQITRRLSSVMIEGARRIDGISGRTRRNPAVPDASRPEPADG